MAYTNPSYYAEIKKKNRKPNQLQKQSPMRFFICSEWPKLCIGLLRIYYSFPNAGGKLLGFIFGGKGRFPGKNRKESRMRMKPTPEVVGGFRDRK